MWQLTKAAIILMKNIDPKYTLIFIGNTPNYIYQILKYENLSVISIPFSGRPYNYNRNSHAANTPTDLGLSRYCSLLKSVGINKELILSENTILVDYTVSFKSTNAFVKILQKCFNISEEELQPMKMIMLLDTMVTKETRGRISYIMKRLDKKYISPISILGFAGLDEIANDTYTRSVPYYSSKYWESNSTTINTSDVEVLVEFYRLFKLKNFIEFKQFVVDKYIPCRYASTKDELMATLTTKSLLMALDRGRFGAVTYMASPITNNNSINITESVINAVLPFTEPTVNYTPKTKKSKKIMNKANVNKANNRSRFQPVTVRRGGYTRKNKKVKRYNTSKKHYMRIYSRRV
jgi:hypothetical protein